MTDVRDLHLSDQGSDQRQQGFVYFVGHALDDGRVKIGFSTKPWERMRQFQDDRVWLAGVPGTREHEQAIHRHFKRYHHTHEWFWLTGELEGYVAWLRAQPFVAKSCDRDELDRAYARDGWQPWMQPEPEREFQGNVVLPFPGFDWATAPASNVVADEYYTRPRYLEAARAVLGGIELDPASSRTANERVRAERYFTINDEALHKPWRARTVWLNPPYSIAGRFAQKLALHHDVGDVQRAIVLVGNRATSTKWFQPLWRHTLCFTDHRVQFDGPDGKGERPDAGHIFVYLGDDPGRFVERFSEFGTAVRAVVS